MAELTVVMDTLPDNDRFLPRYLTVQLLAILQRALPTPAPQELQLSKTALEFIAAHKKPELYTPLTFSFFWRENAEQTLENYTGSLDETDKFGRSALTVALANEDFKLANQLIANGAIVFLEDKLVLEIALISIMQRDPEALNKILACTTPEQPWAADYLGHLHSYLGDNPDSNPRKYRDVLNPTIRHFGQALDTMVYFNGTPSYYGFIGPSIDLLTVHLQVYLKDLKLPSEINLFKPITDAYAFTQRVCKFHANMPTANAAETIYEQIKNNVNKTNNEVVIIFGGWAGNSVSTAFVNNTLVFSNLGMGGDPQQGTIIYSIANPDKLSVELIRKLMFGLANATAPTEILALLSEVVNPQPLYTLNQFLSPIDNCIFSNPRAIIQGILLVLSAQQKSNAVNNESLSAIANNVANIYQAYVNSLYGRVADDLAKFIRNQNLLKNKRIECCSLALEYINQHYTELDALSRCIELKNALEFVGLKDFYNTTVSAEAKAAIQKLMISQQEATALQVIEQEYAMQANQS